MDTIYLNQNNIFLSSGTLLYSKDYNKLIVSIHDDIANYYRSLIPKYISFNKPRYDPHISVIRKEPITNINQWGKYHGRNIVFEYENYIYNCESYLWLNVYCKELENIRLELGLSSTSAITRSPDGSHRFHITIGNFKNL